MAVEFGELREGALGALDPLKEWLLKAKYEPYGNLKLCSDEELVERSGKLLDYLPEDIKRSFNSDKHDNRMIAIHFDEPGSSVPVQDGLDVLLIPIAIKDGAKIDGQGLKIQDYVRLTRQVPAEPEFFALLLMCQS